MKPVSSSQRIALPGGINLAGQKWSIYLAANGLPEKTTNVKYLSTCPIRAVPFFWGVKRLL